jgi:hypothetical protein
MESYELSYDKSNFNENGDLTSYWFDERQKERIANLINSKISEYFQNNFDKLLAEAKERVGQGNIVR